MLRSARFKHGQIGRTQHHCSDQLLKSWRGVLDALPAMPTGDLEPHEAVLTARVAYDRAVPRGGLTRCRSAQTEAVSVHHRCRRERFAGELIEALDRPIPMVDEALKDELNFQTQVLAHAASLRKRDTIVLIAGTLGLSCGHQRLSLPRRWPAGLALAVVGAASWLGRVVRIGHETRVRPNANS
jgi:hypothetical protein